MLLHSSGPPTNLPDSSQESKYESPFRHVLHTNYAPSDADAQKIRDFCVAPEKEIEKLEIEISRLEASLNAVRQERDALRDTVTAHRALLSPIRRLSSEVVQEIFAYCLPEIPVMHVSEAPLLLGRVCRSWRSVVYATAELWSAVHIVIPSVQHTEHRLRRLEALREWFARSGDRPLRISLYADHTAGEVGAFLDLVVPLSPRWELIALFMPATRFKQLEQSFSRINTLSHLRRFELSDRCFSTTWFHHPVPFMDLPDSPVNPLRLLELCTNLHRVSVHVFSDPRHHRTDLPTSVAANLQELDVDYPSAFNSDLGQLLNFITPCQNLRTLRIRASFELVPVFQPPGFITLPALEHLSADMYSFGPNATSMCPALTLVDHLVTPKLLHFDFMNVLNVKDISLSLVKLFTRSSCSLRTLSLHVMANQQDLRPLLSSLEYATDLRELTIDCLDPGPDAIEDASTSYREHDAFLRGLAYTDDASNNYCPNLTHLTLANYTMGIDTDSLLILVKSRLKPPPECARLQTLDLRGLLPPPWVPGTFEVVVPVDPEFKASLDLVKELRAQGLTILLPDLILEDPQLLSPWTGIMPR